MRFKESLLSAIISSPVVEWQKGGIYRIILLLPYFVLVYTFGIVVAIIVDMYVATIAIEKYKS